MFGQRILLNPYRITKYLINNQGGDLEALIAQPGFISIMKRLPEAHREVMKMMRHDPMLPERLQKANRDGVLWSGPTMQEIKDSSTYEVDRLGDLKIDVKDRASAIKALRWYMSKTHNLASLRENVFRYATYIHYHENLCLLYTSPSPRDS